MKLAALILLAVTASAHAEILMTMPNEDGGLIEFSDGPCPGEGLQAYVIAASGEVVEDGCWDWAERDIEVFWKTAGRTYYYDPANVTLTKAGRKIITRKRT